MSTTDLAIVGAGMAGATAAHFLRGKVSFEIFEQGRHVGGRCSSINVESGPFDCGAQFFGARDPWFREQAEDWLQRRVAANWEGRFGVLGLRGFQEMGSRVRLVGVPDMGALVRDLLGKLPVRTQTCVTRARYASSGWQLTTTRGEFGPYRALLLAMPAMQAVRILKPRSFSALAGIVYEPCVGALVSLREPSGLEFDGAVVRSGADGLAWVARETHKSGRSQSRQHWVLHSTGAWAAERAEHDVYQCALDLWDGFCERTGLSPNVAGTFVGQRWPYARVTVPLGKSWLWDDEVPLGWVGDGALGPRVEAAYLSGRAAAAELLSR